MVDVSPLIDQTARDCALDPTRSFIVEAPAGSGKTELLTRRFLTLLDGVQAPEEIIAITFTRKAAAEMRARILKGLPAKYHTLVEDPQRLRIMTIDALCAYLVRQMPCLSQFGTSLTIADDIDRLYEKAAQQFLLSLENNEAWSAALKEILIYLDNNASRVVQLFVRMLANRDQWLPHILTINSVDHLEEALARLAAEVKQQCLALLPKDVEPFVTQCLTKEGRWRKRFPKELKHLEKYQDDLFLENILNELQFLPATQYSFKQRQFIQALVTALPILVAQLQLVFAEEGAVDYIEIAQRALQALGEAENPTQLALHLDYKISHLLVDEFQDTSVTQFRLLEHLVAGWQPGDGRTLFLVGDPMQSIYRFRKAEVKLFLQVQQFGLGQVACEKLMLKTNFRSTPSLAHWFDQVFRESIPKSVASKNIHCFRVADEASAIARIVQENPGAHIAVLVRARGHLKEILPLLQQQNIAYRAVEIAFLNEDPLIQDLYALTGALLQLHDRIAWLSILRAPWCGLTLNELHEIAAHDHESSIWGLILQSALPQLDYFKSVMRDALSRRGRCALSQWVKQTWIKLLGPACLHDKTQLKYAEQFFILLDQLEQGNDALDVALLEKRLAQLPMPVMTDDDIRLDVMTIHKAKGLEFDMVILPGLERSTRSDDAQLLLWMERPSSQHQIDLIVGSIKSAQEEDNSIYDYLKREEAKLAFEESKRLLYVAVTRAKKELYMFVPQALEKPNARSLLAHIWSVIENQLIDVDQVLEPVVKNNHQSLKRLKHAVLPLQQLNDLSVTLPHIVLNEPQKHIGTLVHRLLCQLSRGQKINTPSHWRQYLLQLGVLPSDIEFALAEVECCMNNVLQDKRAQWILDVTHQESASEYPLTAVMNDQVVHVVLDRTFVDENNQRWIIDYKTTHDVDRLHYEKQLARYASIMQLQETRPIQLGLYFPLTSDWVAWPWQN